MPLVTASAGIFGIFFGGAPLLETVFSWPGMGRMFLDAALKRDFPIMLAAWLITSTIILVGRMFADVLYAVVDPRIRLQ